MNPADGSFLGNFPQAFAHLALINSAVHLQLWEEGGAAALAGTHADRARRAAELAGLGEPMRRDLEQLQSNGEEFQSVLDLRGLIRPVEAGARREEAWL